MSKEKKIKIKRPKAEAPKGFRDYFGSEIRARNLLLQQIMEVYHLYGFEALETSAIETVEALGKFLPDIERPNEGVFAWQEDEGWLALRYDLTAPLARVYAENQNHLPSPYRRYSMGPVWRNEKPGPGRFRQFYQCDADTVGASNVLADAEMCTMLSDTLEATGISRGDYIIKVNNRKILNGVLEKIGIFDETELEKFSNQRGIVLRAIDKLDRLGIGGVKELLGKGRKDSSGDYTDGANLSTDQVDLMLMFLEANSKTNMKTLLNLSELVVGSKIGEQGVRELEKISESTDKQGYGVDRIKIDPSVVRGLGYYTGPVLEAELTFETIDEKGKIRRFGSVAGGGRYDDLVKRFTGQEVPATGVSIGVDRLLAALRSKSKLAETTQGPVIITVMDRDRIDDYQLMAAELRNAGVRSEVYFGNPKNFGNQLKYADNRNSPLAIIEGGNEREKGVVLLKDLYLGSKLASQMLTNDEWKSQPAQISINRENLVTEVIELLSRYKQ
ncbi:MAG: histidine--tRNA ligase [Rhodobacterales bacterium]